MEYSPVIAESINQMQGLSPEYMKQGFNYIDNYLRDSALSLTAFGRGLEYEADLLGTQYARLRDLVKKLALNYGQKLCPMTQIKLLQDCCLRA